MNLTAMDTLDPGRRLQDAAGSRHLTIEAGQSHDTAPNKPPACHACDPQLILDDVFYGISDVASGVRRKSKRWRRMITDVAIDTLFEIYVQRSFAKNVLEMRRVSLL
jgi:hypothetical protein